MIIGVRMSAGGSATRTDNPAVNEVQIDAGVGITINDLDQQFDLLVKGHTVWLQYDHSATDWVVLDEKLPAPVTWIYTTGTPTWTRPRGRQWFRSTVAGGGGSGGKDNGGASFGGGGSGGGTAIGELQLTAATQAVTVGAGGAAQTTAATAGNNGNNSTFSTLTGNGGIGGSITTSVSGGAASGGDLQIAGDNGAPGYTAYGGPGGSSFMGGGGAGKEGAVTATAGTGYGGGGGGSGTGTSGAGAPGVVIVEAI
jgi:hypothetical protein